MMPDLAAAARAAVLAGVSALAVVHGAQADPPMGVPHPTDTMVFALAANGGNCGSCEWIAAEGPFTERTPEDLETFLKTFNASGWFSPDGVLTVRLNSNGGNLMAGLRLGEAIRAHKLNTEVARTVDNSFGKQETAQGGCYSACAYAFLGGVNRIARPGSLGFHQFVNHHASVDETLKANDGQSAQKMMGWLVIYLQKMSVDPTLLSLAASAEPTDLLRPDAETLLKLNVTNVRDAPLFSGWSIEPYRAGAVITGKLSEGAADSAQQLTFFCKAKAPGKVFMLASWQNPWASPGAAITEKANVSATINAWDSTLTIGGKPVRQSQGQDSVTDVRIDNADRWFLTYTLDAGEFAAALKNGKLEVKIGTPHVVSDSMGFTFAPPIPGLAAAARIAFKSCLA
jgi:hypothetical protein